MDVILMTAVIRGFSQFGRILGDSRIPSENTFLPIVPTYLAPTYSTYLHLLTQHLPIVPTYTYLPSTQPYAGNCTVACSLLLCDDNFVTLLWGVFNTCCFPTLGSDYVSLLSSINNKRLSHIAILVQRKSTYKHLKLRYVYRAYYVIVYGKRFNCLKHC